MAQKLQNLKEGTKTNKRGTVNFFSKPHGFGFIKLQDTKEDVFVHISHLRDAIKENDLVQFDLAKGVKGWIATKVELA